MKLPVIIHHHPEGYTVHIPDEEFNDMLSKAKQDLAARIAAKRQEIDKDEAADEVVRNLARQEAELTKQGTEIPERWRKPCKPFQGFVYGLDFPVTAEGDSVEEVISTLKAKATEATIGIAESALRDWPQCYSIHEIEI